MVSIKLDLSGGGSLVYSIYLLYSGFESRASFHRICIFNFSELMTFTYEQQEELKSLVASVMANQMKQFGRKIDGLENMIANA